MKTNELHMTRATPKMRVWVDPVRPATVGAESAPPPHHPHKPLILNELRQIISYCLVGYGLNTSIWACSFRHGVGEDVSRSFTN